MHLLLRLKTYLLNGGSSRGRTAHRPPVLDDVHLVFVLVVVIVVSVLLLLMVMMMVVVGVIVIAMRYGGRRMMMDVDLRRRRRSEVHVGQIAPDHDIGLSVEPLGLRIHHQQPRLVRHGFDPLHDLLVILQTDVGAVDLDDAVAFAQPGGLGRTARVHLADELSGFGLLGVQVEAVAVEVGPLGHVTQSGLGRVVRDGLHLVRVEQRVISRYSISSVVLFVVCLISCVFCS